MRERGDRARGRAAARDREGDALKAASESRAEAPHAETCGTDSERAPRQPAARRGPAAARLRLGLTRPVPHWPDPARLTRGLTHGLPGGRPGAADTPSASIPGAAATGRHATTLAGAS